MNYALVVLAAGLLGCSVRRDDHGPALLGEWSFTHGFCAFHHRELTPASVGGPLTIRFEPQNRAEIRLAGIRNSSRFSFSTRKGDSRARVLQFERGTPAFGDVPMTVNIRNNQLILVQAGGNGGGCNFELSRVDTVGGG